MFYSRGNDINSGGINIAVSKDIRKPCFPHSGKRPGRQASQGHHHRQHRFHHRLHRSERSRPCIRNVIPRSPKQANKTHLRKIRWVFSFEKNSHERQ